MDPPSLHKGWGVVDTVAGSSQPRGVRIVSRMSRARAWWIVPALVAGVMAPSVADARILTGTADQQSVSEPTPEPSPIDPAPGSTPSPTASASPDVTPSPPSPTVSVIPSRPPVTPSPTAGASEPSARVPVDPRLASRLEGQAAPSPASASLACDGPVTTQANPGRRWDAVVVDPIRRLPDGWVPADLVEVADVGYRGRSAPRVRAGVEAALRDMHAAAIAANARFVVVSAFRSQDDQARLWNDAVAEDEAQHRRGNAAPGTARPGHSEHQLGTTIDVVDPSLPHLGPGLVDTPAGRWLAANATAYGFVVTYPDGQSDTTCFKAEPWHLRYVGPAVAAAVAASGLTLREFLLPS